MQRIITTRQHKQLIVIEFFVKTQAELAPSELDSPLSSSFELEEEPEESELDDDPLWLVVLQTRNRFAIGVFRKNVEYAFCAALSASCLFFPLHLS